MSKRGRTSTMADDVHAPTPTLHPPRSETGMSSSILMLTNTNYHLWAMRIEVSLEAHDLWGVIDGSEVNWKKDRLALSMILSSISESQSNQIDIKKSAKENWEVLRTFHVGMDKVVQAKVQALKMEFEIITMKRNEKIDDYSNFFARMVTDLRDLGKSLDDYGAISRLHKSVPKDFDYLILLLEQTSDLKTMRLEEAFGQLEVHELKLQERISRDEEQALLSRAFNMSKKDQKGSSSSGRGRGKKGRYRDAFKDVRIPIYRLVRRKTEK